MRRALVTGATGLLGSHIVDRLQAEGVEARALIRSAAAAEELRRRGVETLLGDVLDRAAFIRAATGCDTIFHAAAAITSPGGWAEYDRVNVGGTRNAVVAAAASGARLVHVSSVAVYGGSRYSADGSRTDESAVSTPIDERSHYARSKRISEELVLSAHSAGHIWATAIRPDVIYGSRDRQFIPRLARLLMVGIAPLFGRGRNTLAIVHAANVADGAYRAALADVAGGRAYNLANDFDVTAEEFFRLAASGLGRRVVMLRLPISVARSGIRVVHAADTVFLGGRFGVATAGSLDFMSRDNPFTSERARIELGWAPAVRPEVGIPEAFRWWRSSR